MAVTATLYNKWKLRGVSPEALASLDVRATLHTSTYAPDIDADEFFDDTTNEVSGGSGYTPGGELLNPSSTGIDTGGDFAYADYDDVRWLSLTKTFRRAVLRVDTGNPATDQLIGYIDYGANQSPVAIDFVIEWAAIASGGFWKVA